MTTYATTFVLPFCSIVYELLLSQTLSAIIGLYMMSLSAKYCTDT